MNEKLICRAASKYRSWVVSKELQKTERWKAHILNTIERTKSKADQMFDWATRFFYGSEMRFQRSKWDNKTHRGIVNPKPYERIATNMISGLGIDVVHGTQRVVEMLRTMVEQKTIIVPSIREAMEEIRAIINEWPKVEFRNNILSVTTEDITLEGDNGEEVNLGRFIMHVDLTHPSSSLRIFSVDKITTTKGFCHPHVSRHDEKLCIGNGDLPSQEALCQGRLEDYFRIVDAVLHTYNSVSPHEKLSEWYDPDHEDESYCESCGEWHSHDYGNYCEPCGNWICDSCDDDGGCCSECNIWGCSECSTTCGSCGEKLCNDCVKTCIGCETTCCNPCLSLCVSCENQFCSECKKDCSCCGDPVCENCTSECACCGDNCCGSCYNEECEACGADICQGCKTTCDECGDVLCTTCEENECEGCGTSMCKPCEKKHECLLMGVESSPPTQTGEKNEKNR